MSETVLTMLQRHPFVEQFGAENVDTLAAIATRVRFDRDQIVFREGDECSDFFLIVSGLVALEVTESGHTFRIQTLSAGQEFGWSALLMGSGKHFQARALERVEALALDGGALLTACKRDPHFGFTLMQRLLGVVAERLQATRLQLHDMYSPIAKRAGA